MDRINIFNETNNMTAIWKEVQLIYKMGLGGFGGLYIINGE